MQRDQASAEAGELAIVVIGASAGGVEALQAIARGLPADLPAAVCIVLHTPATGLSLLPEILDRAGVLRAAHVNGRARLRPGQIVVAPPDRHLTIRDGFAEAVRGPRENRSRPSVDVLFRSAALAYGPRVVGVILSGMLDDGALGLRTIKDRGGRAIVQDPAEALFAGMPTAALDIVAADVVCPAELIPAAIAALSRATLEDAAATPAADELKEEVAMSDADLGLMNVETHPGRPSAFACPDCSGVLWELDEGDLVHYRCRVGHAYAPDSLLAAQFDGVEEALWMALRTLEERADLLRRVRDRATKTGQHAVARRYVAQIEETNESAASIRRLLVNGRVEAEERATTTK